MSSHLEVALSEKRIIVVDYLKGFSILTIALMHLLGLMPSVPSRIVTLSAVGGSGVHAFFLCSGLGLYFSYLNHKMEFAEFLKKRFYKIYIPYIIIVMISFVLPWMYEGSDRGMALLSHVFLFKMFVPQYEESFGTQFWFVSTIFQLYLLFIPMCWFKEKVKNNKLFGLCCFVISVIWWISCYLFDMNKIRTWGSFCLQYIWEFAIGFILAEKIYHGKTYRINIYLLLLLAIVGIGLQAGLALTSDAFKVFNDVPAFVGYTSLALLLYCIPFVKRICNKLSAFSYEYFLIHMLIFVSIFHIVKPQGLLMECISGSLAMFIALILAYYFNRIMKALNKRIK